MTSWIHDHLLAARRRLGPLWWHTSLMFVSSRIGDIVSVYIGILLVPAVLSEEKLGAVVPVIKLTPLVAAPLSVLLATGLKYISVFESRGQRGRTKALLRDLILISAVLSVLLVGVLGFGRTFIQERLKIEDPLVIWLVAALAVLTFWTPLAQTFARGLKKFKRIIFL